MNSTKNIIIVLASVAISALGVWIWNMPIRVAKEWLGLALLAGMSYGGFFLIFCVGLGGLWLMVRIVRHAWRG